MNISSGDGQEGWKRVVVEGTGKDSSEHYCLIVEDEKQLTGRYFVHLPVSSALWSLSLFSVYQRLSVFVSVCLCVCLLGNGRELLELN